MRIIITELKCYACDDTLTEQELGYQDIFDGMCERCYAESMEAAYDDDEEN